MKEIKVYNAIHQLKERGFKKDSVAKQLDINWRTVDRYWDMTIEEYESQARQLKRGSQLDDYKDQILLWLRQYPAMTAAQVGDWLKEHYKASPALVKDFVERLEIVVDKHKYLNFQRLDQVDGSIEFYGVLIFATPDILSGLVSWVYYDNSSDDAVCTPWGSGCSTTIRQVIIEEECLGSRCFIGLFDPSVRPRVRANELMFGIPKSRLEEMATFMRDTCLFNGAAWPKVKERIKDGSTEY